MNAPTPRKKPLMHNLRRWAGAYVAYFAMVGASIAAAASMVSESVPLMIVGA